MDGDERIRLFCALRLPEDVLDLLVQWQRGLQLPGGVRAVPRENLHVTLVFLGPQPLDRLAPVAAALQASARAASVRDIEIDGYRETRSVGMLVLVDPSGAARVVANDLHVRLERLGVYRRERRPWLPHVTVLRFRERPRLCPALPELPLFSPSDAAVYRSVLRPSGAQYEILETVALRR